MPLLIELGSSLLPFKNQSTTNCGVANLQPWLGCEHCKHTSGTVPSKLPHMCVRDTRGSLPAEMTVERHALSPIKNQGSSSLGTTHAPHVLKGPGKDSYLSPCGPSLCGLSTSGLFFGLAAALFLALFLFSDILVWLRLVPLLQLKWSCKPKS